jgi:hypothetical protein
LGTGASVQSAQFRQRATQIADLNLIGSACKRRNALQAGALEVLHLTQSSGSLFPQRFADRHPKELDTTGCLPETKERLTHTVTGFRKEQFTLHRLAIRARREGAVERSDILSNYGASPHDRRSVGGGNMLQTPLLEVLRRTDPFDNRCLGHREAEQARSIVVAPETQETVIIGQVMTRAWKIECTRLGRCRCRCICCRQSDDQQYNDGRASNVAHHGCSPAAAVVGMDD